MKAIGIKMIDLQPMTAREANDKGYRIGEHSFETDGYEVTYPDGYKSWSPKEVAVDAIWAGLGFVLQWAKFGLNKK